MGKNFRNGVKGSSFYFSREGVAALQSDKKGIFFNELLNLVYYDNAEIEMTESMKVSVRKNCSINNRQEYSRILNQLVKCGLVLIINTKTYMINPYMSWYGSIGKLKEAKIKYDIIKEALEKKRHKRIF